MSDLRSLREQLLGRISRWKREMLGKPARATLSQGMLDACYKLVERMLLTCTLNALALTGTKGKDACAACAPGKPVSRMTLGQLVQVLEYLDFELGRVLSRHLSKPRARILADGDGLLLRSIVKNRNKFVHDSSSLSTQQVIDTFDMASRVCDLDLVTIMASMARKDR